VWAPIGERPIAHGHHRFDWLYVTAFVSPATWALSALNFVCAAMACHAAPEVAN
jgi:hypothetical protein